MRYTLFTLISAALLSLGGCYNPDLGSNPFKCGTFDECPDGYFCHTMADPSNPAKEVSICVTKTPPDKGIPDRRFMTDTEILPWKDGPVYLDSAHLAPAPANCADASNEPNNSGATATPLIPSGTVISGWEICYRGDVDQFKLSLDAGKKLTVKVMFTHLKGDLDAALVGPDGYITASRSTTSNETLTVSNASSSAEKYTLGVWGYNFDLNTYDLDIQVQ